MADSDSDSDFIDDESGGFNYLVRTQRDESQGEEENFMSSLSDAVNYITRNENEVVENINVDDSNRDAGENVIQESAAGTNLRIFDDDLPLEHSYLGSNLEVLSGRVILSEGGKTCIPLLPKFHGTVIPGQTLPLTVRDPSSMEMLRKCFSTNHTFGCVARSYPRVPESGPQYGTTVEIYEFADNNDYVNAKAKARQRFKLLKTHRSEFGYLLGFVEILPEIILDNPLCIIQSLARYRRTKRDWCRKREALMSVWPSWVYDMYDSEKIVKRVHNDLSFLNRGLKKECGKGEMMPHDVSQLSFWVGTHFDTDRRLILLTLNSPVQRLRYQLSSMTEKQEYVCGSCECSISNQSHVFAMSTEGAQSTFVNPLGMVHDTLTFKKVTNVTLITQPSTQYSWFPGYAWSIGICSVCRKHLGWRFTAVNKSTVPNQFYGLTRDALQVRILMASSELPAVI